MDKARCVKFGDSIALMIEEKDAFLSGGGVIDNRLFIAEMQQSEYPPNFRDCLFEVVPACSYAARQKLSNHRLYIETNRMKGLKGFGADAYNTEYMESLKVAAKTEVSNFEIEQQKVMGHVVLFGSHCQFRHLASGKFLSVKKIPSQRDNNALFMELTQDGGDGSVYKMVPGYKTKIEGEPVRRNDSIVVRNMKYRVMMSFGGDPIDVKSTSIPQSKYIHDVYEVHAKAIKTSWKVVLVSHGVSIHEDEVKSHALVGGDIVRLFHQDSETYLYHSREGKVTTIVDLLLGRSANRNAKSDPLVSLFKHTSDPKQEKFNSNSLWRIEAETVEGGGEKIALGSGRKYRLAHLSTGKYLALKKKPVQSRMLHRLDSALSLTGSDAQTETVKDGTDFEFDMSDDGAQTEAAMKAFSLHEVTMTDDYMAEGVLWTFGAFSDDHSNTLDNQTLAYLKNETGDYIGELGKFGKELLGGSLHRLEAMGRRKERDAFMIMRVGSAVQQDLIRVKRHLLKLERFISALSDVAKPSLVKAAGLVKETNSILKAMQDKKKVTPDSPGSPRNILLEAASGEKGAEPLVRRRSYQMKTFKYSVDPLATAANKWFETVRESLDLILGMVCSASLDPYGLWESAEPVYSVQRMLYDIGMVNVLVRILEFVPRNVDSPTYSRFLELTGKCCRILIFICRGNVPIKNSVKDFMPLFESFMGTGVNASDIVSELLLDNSALLDSISHTQVEVYVKPLSVKLRPRYVRLLETICTCNGQPFPKNQNIVLDVFLARRGLRDKKGVLELAEKMKFGTTSIKARSQDNEGYFFTEKLEEGYKGRVELVIYSKPEDGAEENSDESSRRIRMLTYVHKMDDIIRQDTSQLEGDDLKVVYHYQCLHLTLKICEGRNRKAIERLIHNKRLLFSYDELLTLMKLDNVPHLFRAMYAELMIVMFIDREFNESYDCVNRARTWSQSFKKAALTRGNSVVMTTSNIYDESKNPREKITPGYSDLKAYVREYLGSFPVLTYKTYGKNRYALSLVRIMKCLISHGYLSEKSKAENEITEFMPLILAIMDNKNDYNGITEPITDDMRQQSHLDDVKAEACDIIVDFLKLKADRCITSAFEEFEKYFENNEEVLRKLRGVDEVNVRTLLGVSKAIRAFMGLKGGEEEGDKEGESSGDQVAKDDAGAGGGDATASAKVSPEPQQDRADATAASNDSKEDAGGKAAGGEGQDQRLIRHQRKEMKRIEKMENQVKSIDEKIMRQLWRKEDVQSFLVRMRSSGMLSNNGEDQQRALTIIMGLLKSSNHTVVAHALTLLTFFKMEDIMFVSEMDQVVIVVVEQVVRVFKTAKTAVSNLFRAVHWITQEDSIVEHTVQCYDTLLACFAEVEPTLGHQNFLTIMRHLNSHIISQQLLIRIEPEMRAGNTRKYTKLVSRIFTFLKKFCGENETNQRMIFPMVGQLLQFPSADNINVADTITAVLSNNIKLSHEAPDLWVTKALDMIKYKGRSHQFLRLVESLIVSRTSTNREKQDLVLQQLLEDPRTLMTINGVHVSERLDKHAATIDSSSIGVMHPDLEYLVALLNTLASCSMGKNHINVMKCRYLLELDDILQVILEDYNTITLYQQIEAVTAIDPGIYKPGHVDVVRFVLTAYVRLFNEVYLTDMDEATRVPIVDSVFYGGADQVEQEEVAPAMDSAGVALERRDSMMSLTTRRASEGGGDPLVQAEGGGDERVVDDSAATGLVGMVDDWAQARSEERELARQKTSSRLKLRAARLEQCQGGLAAEDSTPGGTPITKAQFLAEQKESARQKTEQRLLERSNRRLGPGNDSSSIRTGDSEVNTSMDSGKVASDAYVALPKEGNLENDESKRDKATIPEIPDGPKNRLPPIMTREGSIAKLKKDKSSLWKEKRGSLVKLMAGDVELTEFPNENSNCILNLFSWEILELSKRLKKSSAKDKLRLGLGFVNKKRGHDIGTVTHMNYVFKAVIPTLKTFFEYHFKPVDDKEFDDRYPLALAVMDALLNLMKVQSGLTMAQREDIMGVAYVMKLKGIESNKVSYEMVQSYHPGSLDKEGSESLEESVLVKSLWKHFVKEISDMMGVYPIPNHSTITGDCFRNLALFLGKKENRTELMSIIRLITNKPELVPESTMTIALNLILAVLHLDPAPDYNESQWHSFLQFHEVSRDTKHLRPLQIFLKNNNILLIPINTISTSRDQSKTLPAVRILHGMMVKPTAEMQEALIQHFMDNPETTFFQVARDEIREMVASIKRINEVAGGDLYENENPHGDLDTTNANEQDFRFVIFLLKMFKLWCSNTFSAAQNFLHYQEGLTHSFDIVLEMVDALNSITPVIIGALEAKTLNSANWSRQMVELGIYLAECLIECLRGRNYEAKGVYLATPLLDSINLIFSRVMYSSDNLERRVRFKTQISSLFYELVDGIRSTVHARKILEGIDWTSLLAHQIIYNYYIAQPNKVSLRSQSYSFSSELEEKLKNRSDQLTPHLRRTILEDSFTCFASMRQMELFEGQYVAEDASSMCRTRLCTNKARLDNMCVKHALQGEEDYPELEYYNRWVGVIEVVRDNAIERIHFRVPESFSRVLAMKDFKERKMQFLHKVPRDNPNEKAQAFLERLREAAFDFEHRSRIMSRKSTAWLVRYGWVIANGPFFIAVMLSVLATLFYSELTVMWDDVKVWDQWTHFTLFGIYGIGSLCHLLLSAILILWWTVMELPLHVYRRQEERRHHGSKISHRRSCLGKCSVALRTPITYYYVAFVFFSMLGLLISPYFYTFHLLDIYRYGEVRDTLVSVTGNASRLLQVAVLGLIVLYLFVVFVHIAIPTTVLSGNCEGTLFECFLHFLGNWSDISLIQEIPDPPGVFWDGPGDVVESLFRVFYTAFTVIFFIGILQGLIIDNLGKIRDENARGRDDLSKKCFICSIDRYTLEQAGTKFFDHTTRQHAPWTYLLYLVYLRTQDPAMDSGQDSYVRDLVERDDHSFIPVQRALCIEGALRARDGTDQAARATEQSGQFTAALTELGARLSRMEAVLSVHNQIQASLPRTNSIVDASTGIANEVSRMPAQVKEQATPSQSGLSIDVNAGYSHVVGVVEPLSARTVDDAPQTPRD